MQQQKESVLTELNAKANAEAQVNKANTDLYEATKLSEVQMRADAIMIVT